MTAQNQSDTAPANSGTKVVQITNIAPQATKDQMQTLFGFLGKIEDIRLYPTIRDVSVPVQSRICYVKFFDPNCVGVAQHMTNTVFIDRALIVTPYSAGEIPDEYRALDIAAQTNIIPGLYAADPKLPPHVTNQIEGMPPNQVITTHDPLLASNGLPPYPPLPVTYDARRIEEIRRTLLVINIDNSISAQQLIDFFSTAGDVKYVRFCTRDNDSNRYALLEFSEQSSIIPGLKMNGTELAGKMIQVYHATQAIAKPMAKSNEAAQREIEEAMTRVKEAQSLISAAIDPVIGILSKDKKRSRSGSKTRRSRSRSRGRRHRRSRSRSRHRSRHHRRSRSKSRRSRSRSKISRSRRSRSRDKKRRSRDRKRSRSRSRSKSKRSKRSRSRRRSRSKSKSRSRKDRSKSPRKSKDKDKKKDKERKSEDKTNLDKISERSSKASIKSEPKDSDSDKLDSDSKKAKSVSRTPDKKIGRSRSRSRGDSGSPRRRSTSLSPGRRRISRSPSRSPIRHKSRSPRKLSRSPVRKRRSHSSGRKGSRSPGSRSVSRYRSRSGSPPPRRHSRSGSP
ncbi:probable splicing factor, arginine/serine-rich 7 [Macrosteles quadrilineatus]|uniref:probable splicing factor, arginine/serine-rich 7 n=1 Tax=Macrosteles quadrilineatus TaxID=74068 RepID=UPI0023E10D66|nr:probable splicing factor, arginine/serine-rich 7 [Macrosteles quadrilineatus]